MKAILLLALVAAAFAATQRAVEDDLRMWDDWKATYGKQFSASEDVARFACFRRNLDLIDERNARGAEQHGVNLFTHMCADEFKRTMLGFWGNATHTPNVEVPTGPTAQQVDWRTKGAVTPIKNQGMCGSCWSFSATGNMEGQWFLAGNTLVGLSEEELVQCDSTCDGCGGGLMDLAFQWVIKNGGIDSEMDYPYTSGGGTTGMCKTNKESKDVAKLSSYHDIPHSESSMASYCEAHGPVSIGVDALSWQTYSGGIMRNCPAGQMDHGVLIVGYDLGNSPPYWIVKNSWGTSWGENGYVRVEYGTNQCNIHSAPSSSIVA